MIQRAEGGDQGSVPLELGSSGESGPSIPRVALGVPSIPQVSSSLDRKTEPALWVVRGLPQHNMSEVVQARCLVWLLLIPPYFLVQVSANCNPSPKTSHSITSRIFFQIWSLPTRSTSPGWPHHQAHSRATKASLILTEPSGLTCLCSDPGRSSGSSPMVLAGITKHGSG